MSATADPVAEAQAECLADGGCPDPLAMELATEGGLAMVRFGS